jgi:endonuclease/exonuclease/phosphatase family metal-dependent hydrolase
VIACAHQPRGDAPSLRVLVYNIHAGKDAGGVDNLDGVVGLVRQTGADLVLLQEVDQGTRRSGHVDQPSVLSERSRLHVAFGSSLDYDGGKYGIAILSRWPITADTLIHLAVDPPQERSGGSHEPRGVLRILVASPYGPLTVFNTHLDPAGDDHWRRQEAATILSLVRAASTGGALVIAGGDFNSTPESAIQAGLRAGGLRDAWVECGQGAGLTYPADSSIKRIDYLFLTGKLRCTSGEVISTKVSDHRPVLLQLARSP